MKSSSWAAAQGCRAVPVNVLPIPSVHWLCLIEQEGAQSVSWGFLLSEAGHTRLGVKAGVLSHPSPWLSYLAPGECVCIIHFSLQAWRVQKFSPECGTPTKGICHIWKGLFLFKGKTVEVFFEHCLLQGEKGPSLLRY